MNVSPKPAPTALVVTLALLGVQFCFGLNYVVLKEIVTNLPPLAWASFRISVATIVFFLFCFASGRPRPKLDREFLLPLAFYSLFGTILNQTAFIMGIRYTTSTNSAILNSMIPLSTLLIVTLRGQEKLTWNRAIGFILALCGVVTLRGIENFNMSESTWIGDSLTILNCLFYGIFLSTSKKFFEKHDPLWASAFLFLYGSVGIGLMSIPHWRQVDFSFDFFLLLPKMLFAIGIGTISAYYLNFWALKYAPASRVALFINLQPIIAGTFAWFWADELITWRMVAASSCIFIGMLVALTDPTRFFKRKVEVNQI